jgi:hypothetical protein
MSAYRPETPHEIAEAWRRFEEALRERHDARRPWGRYRVVDNSPWRATGPSFLWLRADGGKRLAIYRDGPQPANGSYVQAREMSGDAHAMLLALPLPRVVVCGGTIYVSGHDVSGGAGGEWAVLTADLALLAWARRSASPVVGTYARRPLRGCKPGLGGNTRLLTWGVQDAGGGAVGAGSGLYKSDDGGLTWSGAGLTGVRHVSQEGGYGFRGAVLALYAVADDGASIYWSNDSGNTWTPVHAGGDWLAVEPLRFQDGWAAALGVDGGYITTCRFQPRDPLLPPELVGPYQPGSTGFGALMPSGSVGWWQRVAGDSAVRGKTAGWAEEAAHWGPTTIAADPLAGLAGDAAVGYSLWIATDGAAGGLYGVQQQVGIPGGDGFDTINRTWLAYRSAENHPHGLAGIGGRAIATAQGSAPSQCLALALNDDAPGNSTHTRLVTMKIDDIIGGDQLVGAATDASARQVADLGAEYAISHDGLVNLGA